MVGPVVVANTLLLMLGGMLSPTSGHVLLDGESIYELNADQQPDCGRRMSAYSRRSTWAT